MSTKSSDQKNVYEVQSVNLSNDQLNLWEKGADYIDRKISIFSENNYSIGEEVINYVEGILCQK